MKEWEFRKSNAGRPLSYQPDDLWLKFTEYCRWAENNPLYRHDVIKTGEMTGEILNIPLKRPLSITRFCSFADISLDTFLNYEKRPEFLDISKQIRSIIESEQFEGAAVGNYKENIIARVLGLVDKKDVTSNGENISPIVTTLTPGELQDKIKK